MPLFGLPGLRAPADCARIARAAARRCAELAGAVAHGARDAPEVAQHEPPAASRLGRREQHGDEARTGEGEQPLLSDHGL